MVASIKAPIPGQSLTDTPKNYPWERPPQIVDFNEAIKYHIDRLTDADVMDNVFFGLEYGIPSSILVETMMTAAVGQGIHNVDVSLIVFPVVHAFVKSAADEAGINYKTEFTDDEDDPITKAAALVRKSLKATPKEQQDSGFDLMKDVAEELEGTTETETMPEEMPEEEAKPTGLMSRV